MMRDVNADNARLEPPLCHNVVDHWTISRLMVQVQWSTTVVYDVMIITRGGTVGLFSAFHYIASFSQQLKLSHLQDHIIN